jgi:PIN domain nuclease of toxin-antitoxin system
VSVEATVLDASALLASVQDEPGAAEVEPLLESARISAVNWSEVLQKSLAHGVAVDRVERRLRALGMVIEDFTAADARAAATLRSVTRTAGLSLADRACLALAQRLDMIAVTADVAWASLASAAGVRVSVIR